MLTPTYVNVKSFFYPIGNTPAANLLRDYRPGEGPVEILAIGCGDIRNILFTLWSEQHNACAFNFTACDCDPAIIARNMFLLTAITPNLSSEDIERLWRTYYHFYVTSTDLLWIQKHCKQLLSVSGSISSWNESTFASSLKFSTEASLAEVRRIWTLYAQTRTRQEDVKVRREIKSMYESHHNAKGKSIIAAHGVRSAGAHGFLAAQPLSDAFHNFWNTGVVAGNYRDASSLNRDDGGRVNPLMSISPNGSDHFNVHYDADPLAGFHLAEIFDVQKPKAAITNSLATLAKSQFSEWCRAFSSHVAKSSVSIMHHCGDAVNFSHALQAIEGSTILPSFTYFYNRPWSAVPLELPLDMVTKYDIIDTSNVMDHVGLLNLLTAVVPLLSTKHDPVLYTENLLQSSKESEKSLEALLHSDVTMSSLWFGVAPVNYLLGTMTDSTHIEQEMDACAGPMKGRQKQRRVRISWKRPLQGDSLVSDINPGLYRLRMEPHELASFFMQTYLAMFREAEDISIRMEVMMRKMTQPLSGDRGFYSRLSFVTLLASAKRTTCTDWRACISALVSMIENDRSLILGSNSLQELYMQLHLSGLLYSPVLEENPREHTTYYGKPRPTGEPGVLGRPILPGTVHIALIVPRSSLAIFTERPVDQVGTPGLHLHVRNHAFGNAFFAVDTFFGQFESDDIDTASVVEDARGWAGTSDMIITCRVPTWGLLLGRRQDLRVELVITTSPATSSYTMKLGVRNVVFGTSLDSKNVRILTQAPSTKPRAVLSTNLTIAEPAQVTSATVALKHDGTVQSIGVIKDFVPDSEESQALKDGGVVKFSQVSPCVVAISIDELKNTTQFVFPYPVDGAACKLKIARKSLWIEVKTPPSNALQPGGFNIDPFPIVGQGTSSLAWGMGRVDPDLQPVVQLSASTPKLLGLLSSMALSKRERAQTNAKQSSGSMPPMNLLKKAIGQIFSACAGFNASAPGKRINFFVVEHNQDYKILVADTLRHDRDTGSVFLDAFYMPPSAELVKHKSFKAMMADKSSQSLIIDANKEEMALWQRLLPALIERCRSWEHTAACKRKARAAKTVVCDCGRGRDAAHIPKDYKGMAKFAVRVAIPMISAVPYVESMVDEEMVSRMTAAAGAPGPDQKQYSAATTTTKTGCANCGSDKPGLKVCSRCEKVKYCNHACQKAAWKSHKKVCKG
ncbi:hypothetical protein KCU95_g5194, partial [Aureobasidium melanogenum]